MDILCRLDSRLRSDDNANMSIITPVSVTWCEKKSSGNSEQILVGSEEQSLPKNWKIQQVVGIIPEKLFYKGKYFGQKRPPGEVEKFTSPKNREEIQLQTKNKSLKTSLFLRNWTYFSLFSCYFCPF